MGKLLYRFIILIFISLILSCSGGSSTQSVEDIGDDEFDWSQIEDTEDTEIDDEAELAPAPVEAITDDIYADIDIDEHDL